MHGVKRTRQSAAALEAQRLKEATKTGEYLALQETVLKQKKAKSYSADDFDLTTKLLKANPEFYTVWNYRRDIMTIGIFPISTPEDINSRLGSELQMTFSALRQHPKVYWIWNHRRWCLENTPDGPPEEGSEVNSQGWKRANWAKELAVVEKMLDADSRNFHAWDYRRYVFASSPDQRSDESEMAYTTKKIEANFSNFSAWHQRTKVWTSMWAKGETLNAKDYDFELLKMAMYMDHNDQSVWLYHRWLIGDGKDVVLLRREIGVIEELLELEQESKWCLDSLVHYKGLLNAAEPDIQLVNQCKDHLRVLKTLDPPRRKRYEELGGSLSHDELNSAVTCDIPSESRY